MPRYDDYDDDDDDFEDDRPIRRSRHSGRRRLGERPGKVQAIAIMTLIGGIVACLNSAAVIAYLGLVGVASGGFGCVCCLWPGPYYGLTAGILAIVKGSQLLGENASHVPAPRGTAILLIVNIINLDVIGLVLGIICLVFCSDPEVEDFFRG
jgi:hypothetical protein